MSGIENQPAAFATGATGNYSWNGVLDFLQEQIRTSQTKETEWLLEKQQMQTRINSLEGQLSGQENINKDLLRRVKMLEFALRQERIKYAKLSGGHHRVSSDVIHSTLSKGNAAEEHKNQSSQLSASAAVGPQIAKRRAKGNRPLITKFLEEIGYEDIFNNELLLDRPRADTTQISEMINSMVLNETAKNEINQEGSGGENDELNSSMRRPEEEDPSSNLNIDGKENKHPTSSDGSAANDRPQRKWLLDDAEAQATTTSESDKQYSNMTKTMLEKLKSDPSNPLSNTKSPQSTTPPTKWQEKTSLKSHFDAIQSLAILEKDNILASISEDCLIKLWDIRQLQACTDHDNVEPYMNLRGHTCPLFTMTTCGFGDDGVIYSAGSEGIIRAWKPPSPDAVDPFGCYGGKNWCVGVWNGHEETIWDLQGCPIRQMLLSVGADGFVNVWNCQTQSQGDEEGITSSLAGKFVDDKVPDDMPTCSSWIHTNVHAFLVGYASDRVAVVDLESCRRVGELVFEERDGNWSQASRQVNTLASHFTNDIAFAGHEDGVIRLYDLNDGRCHRELRGHTDAVTSLALDPSGLYLTSGSHDATVRTWDLRTFQPLQELPAHSRKYDEGTNCVTIHPTFPYMFSGGSDGLIKLFVDQDM